MTQDRRRCHDKIKAARREEAWPDYTTTNHHTCTGKTALFHLYGGDVLCTGCAHVEAELGEEVFFSESFLFSILHLHFRGKQSFDRCSKVVDSIVIFEKRSRVWRQFSLTSYTIVPDLQSACEVQMTVFLLEIWRPSTNLRFPVLA